jgi:hypothetical protein
MYLDLSRLSFHVPISGLLWAKPICGNAVATAKPSSAYFGTSRPQGKLRAQYTFGVRAKRGCDGASEARRDELNGVGCEAVGETRRLFRENSGFQLLDSRGLFVELQLDYLVEAAIDGRTLPLAERGWHRNPP